MAAIQAKYQITNRADKRRADKEVRKVWAVIEQIEFDTESAIFHAPANWTYREIYEQYLKVWQKAMEDLERYTLKYIKVDKMHFVKMYRPLDYLKN
jgi:hypothetical protein